jgi:Flp pilus assembly protein CpaB
MAEEPTSGLQNWKLLVIALVLAVVAAIVYNIHINQIRETAKGNLVQRMVYKRDMQFGDKITLADIDHVDVDTRYIDRFGDLVKPDETDTIIGKPVNQKVTRDHWLQWSHFQDSATSSGARKIAPGMVAHTITVNPQMTPGDMLRVGDRVNVCAILPDVNKKVKPLTIIEGAKVLAVGGRTVSDHPIAGRGDEGAASYRSLTLELSEKVALKLVIVLTYRSGDPWVDLCPPGEGLHLDPLRHSDEIDVTKDVAHLVNAPAATVTPP